MRRQEPHQQCTVPHPGHGASGGRLHTEHAIGALPVEAVTGHHRGSDGVVERVREARRLPSTALQLDDDATTLQTTNRFRSDSDPLLAGRALPRYEQFHPVRGRAYSNPLDPNGLLRQHSAANCLESPTFAFNHCGIAKEFDLALKRG